MSSTVDLTRRFDRAAGISRRNGHGLDRVARTHRSFTLSAILLSALEAVVAAVARTYRRYRQWRRAAAVYDALRRLDDHTLRDLGFDRGETGSIAAELSGETETTRLRVLISHHPRW